MSATDRTPRLMRALASAWSATLKRENDTAVAFLLAALHEFEEDVLLARVHPDILALVEDAGLRLRTDAHERGVAVPAANDLLARVAALEARLWGGKA